MAGEGRESSVADRRRALLQRAEGVRLRWGWPERLALAGLAALLVGAALPWGTDAAALPLWLGQASSTGAVLVGTALAAVAVPAGTVAAWRWDRLHPVVGLAGAVAALGTLTVKDVDGGPLPLLVPGRIVVLAGGLALVAAACGVALTAVERRRAASWSEGARWEALASDRAAVERVLAESGAEARWPGWAGAALVAVGAGALALVGPWWRGLLDVQGPVRSGIYLEPELDRGESAATVRSGIELLGPARSWAVAAAVLVATAVVVWRGGRRGALAVAAAGAFAWAVMATSTLHGQVERTLVPAIAVGALSLGLVVAIRPSHPETPWAKVAGLLLVMVPALAGVTWSAAEARAREPDMDGPYRVLIGGPDEADNVAAPAFDGLPGSDAAALTGAPVWVGDLPGAVGITDPPGSAGALALWVVRDDRVEVRRIFEDPGVSWPEDVDLAGGTMLALENELSEVGVLRPVLPSDGRGHDAELPEETRAVAVGPGGVVWMQASYDEGPWSPGAIYLATVDELSDPDTPPMSIEEWPEGPPLPAGFVEAMVLGPERAFVVLDSGERIAAVDDDGASETVLGGVPDEACGLNRQAAASWVEPAGQPDDPAESALEVTAPDADGGLWVTLPTPEPHDGLFELGKIDRDGTLRVVDHPLPGIRGIAPHPRGDAVLVVDAAGRLLELPDADAEAVPLPPPPDDCATEEPVVAPPAPALAPLDVADDLDQRGQLLDTRGTRLVGAPSGDEATVGLVLTRVSPDGAEQVVADGRPGPAGRGSGAVTDGVGGAWWLEPVSATVVDLESPFEVRPVHLLADGSVVRSEATLEVGPSLQDFGLWADGDVAYVLGPDTISRVEGDRVDVVAEGPHVESLDGQYDQLMTTRGGDVVAQLSASEALVRLVGGRQEPLLGRPPAAGGASQDPDPDPEAAPDDRPRRTLPVEVDKGLPPDEVHIDGDVVADPAGDGLLVLQDGLLVRVALDGTITPLAQDPRLDGALTVLDGRVILHHDGRSFTLEVPG